MTTIVKEFEITSQGLMTGLESKVKCMPSNEKGIRFHVGNEIVEAKVENVIATDHCVVVGNQNVKVMLIEHFMAACAIVELGELEKIVIGQNSFSNDSDNDEEDDSKKVNGICRIMNCLFLMVEALNG